MRQLRKPNPDSRHLEIEKLYGAVHGAWAVDRFFGSHELLLRPSMEMLNGIEALGRGRLVGLESFAPGSLAERQSVGGMAVALADGSIRYWGEVEEHCRASGLRVAYLDPVDTYRQYIEMAVRHARLSERLRTLGDVQGMESAMARKLLNEVYRSDIELKHFLVVEREKGIIGAMRESMPDCVVVGRGHADILWAESGEGRYGIRFGAYRAEVEPDKGAIARAVREHYLGAAFGSAQAGEGSGTVLPWHGQVSMMYRNTLDSEAASKAGTLEGQAARSSLLRRFSAVSGGKVTEGGRPDFIGTWDREVPARGLFEMTIGSDSGRRVMGAIEDTIGSALFVGSRHGSRFTFEKSYTSQAVLAGGPEERITYEAVLHDERYVGRFHGPASGEFEMWRPGSLPDLRR